MISPSMLTEGMETEADMLKEFGSSCPDYAAGCVVCDGWREGDMRHTDWEDEVCSPL